MSDADFGGLIRRSRERLGLSSSRVAELIGRSAGTVRAWERGTASPTEGAVVSSLAAVLGIDEVTLFESAGLEPPVQRRQVSVEQALRTITPEPSGRRDEPERQTRPGEALFGRIEAKPKPPTPPPPSDPTPVEPAPAATQEPSAAPTARGAHTRSDPVSAERMGVVDRMRAATLRKPKPAPLTTLPPAPVAPSYVEDQDERFSYKLRALFTAAGVFVLLMALAWAGSNLLDAIGAVWDALTQNL